MSTSPSRACRKLAIGPPEKGPHSGLEPESDGHTRSERRRQAHPPRVAGQRAVRRLLPAAAARPLRGGRAPRLGHGMALRPPRAHAHDRNAPGRDEDEPEPPLGARLGAGPPGSEALGQGARPDRRHHRPARRLAGGGAGPAVRVGPSCPGIRSGRRRRGDRRRGPDHRRRDDQQPLLLGRRPHPDGPGPARGDQGIGSSPESGERRGYRGRNSIVASRLRRERKPRTYWREPGVGYLAA
jgi:hypothetical protein